MIGLLDHVPEEGEAVTAPDGTILRVDKMDKNRIEKIYIRIPDKDETEE